MHAPRCLRWCVVTVLSLAIGSAFADPVGTKISYQGLLKKDGELVNDTCDLRFSAYSALVGGDLEGGPVDVDDFLVVDGQLTGTVDFGGGVFQGEARWLQIEVKCTNDGAYISLDPRQELNPTPYSIGLSLPFEAVYDEPGSVLSVANIGGGRAATLQISNAANSAAALNVLTNGSGPAGRFFNDAGGDSLEATAIASADAVHGTAASGAGVYGEGSASDGVGVHGAHTSGTGTDPGILGETNSTDADASGVLGRLTTPIPGAKSAGVRGINNAVGSNGAGVYGEHATEGSGVYGFAPDRFGEGVFGESDDGIGVRGKTASTFDNAAGVFGAATAAIATRGTSTYGVYGESYGTDGVGVKGVHVATDGTAAGVHGESASMEDGAVGVLGRATASGVGGGGAGETYGVRGESQGTSGYGVYGSGDTGVYGQGGIYGVQGHTDTGHGIHGVATTSGTAVYAGAFGSARAIWAENLLGTGSAITALSDVSYALFADSNSGTCIRAETGGATAYAGNFIQTAGGGVALRASGTTAIQAVGDVQIFGEASVEVLEITGADLAEKFPFSEPVEPGMVVAIDPDHPGKLCVSREPYNKRVAGIVSGANDLSVGVVLGNQKGSESHHAVALSGRVWVHCDAIEKSVEPGDFLTTAARSGYAMPVLERDRATGAIIGKAMTGLSKGEAGLVLVLVNLQ